MDQNVTLSSQFVAAKPEQTGALQRLKIWAKLAKGDLHTITKHDVEELFGVLDTEERGEISRDDLLVLRQIPGLSLTAEDVENLVNDADKDNSGKVNQEELFKALTQGELAYSVVLSALGQKKAALKTTECDKEDLIEYLRFEYETKSSLWSLPQTMILFIAFCLSMTGHISVSTAYSMQNALLGEIEGEGAPYLHKYVHDVPTFWDWMESSFISSIFKSGPADLEIWPYPGRVASYNQLIGGVQLERQNSDPGLCAQSDALRSFYDTRHGGRCHKTDQTRVNSEFIHYHLKAQEIQQQITELRKSSITNRSWVDQNTTKVTARMLLYNGHLEAFTMVLINFNFKATGEVGIAFDMETILSDPYSNILWLVPDLIFALIVLRMFYSEMLELVPAIMNGLDGFQQYMQFWNIIDWFSILVGIMVMTAWGLISGQVSGSLQGKISDLNMAVLDDAVFTNRTYLTPMQFDMVLPRRVHNEKVAALHQEVTEVVFLHRSLRLMIFFYNFVLMMKFFKAFQANPRLNIVIKTMQTSAIDIIHFLIVFLVIFFVFSSAAYVYFGHSIKEFSTQEKAMMYCWRILMGEFDVEAMEGVNPFIAYLWILVFQFLVLQVLLNMLLAIIMDTYAAVNAPGAETIWAQIREALHTARETRGHLDLWYLICEFEDEDYQVHPDRVTSKSLRVAFESQKMTKHNADYLIRKTAEYVKAKEAKSELKLTDAVRIISQMRTTTLRVQENVESIHNMIVEDRRKPQEERFDAIMRGEDPDALPNNRFAKTSPTMANGFKGSQTGNKLAIGNGTTNGATYGATNGAMNGATNGAMVATTANQVAIMPQSQPRRASNTSNADQSRRPSALSLSNFPSNVNRSHAPVPGMMPGAQDHEEIIGYLEQQQMTLDGIRSDQLRIEQSLIQEVRDFRVYVEQRDSWIEQRLNSLDRRFEKVERATDRLTTSMQGFDFRELMGATDRVAHFLQLQQQGMVGAGSPSPVRRHLRASEDNDDWSGDRRRSSFHSESDHASAHGDYDDMDGDVGQVGEVALAAAHYDSVGRPVSAMAGSAITGGGDGLNKAARQQLTTQLERIGEQVQQLVSHAEESADTRRMLWKIDLNLRQTRTTVQKIEEMGLRAPAPMPMQKNPSEGFAKRHQSMRSGHAMGRAASETGVNSAGVSSGPLSRLPAVPLYEEQEHRPPSSSSPSKSTSGHDPSKTFPQ